MVCFFFQWISLYHWCKLIWILNFLQVGMAATLASVCSVPLTSVLLLFELTKDYRILLPLMVAFSFFLVWFKNRQVQRPDNYKYCHQIPCFVAHCTTTESIKTILSTYTERYKREREMSCLLSCWASLSCGLCTSVASGISGRSARLGYRGLFGLSIITSWILIEFGAPLLEYLPCKSIYSLFC